MAAALAARAHNARATDALHRHPLPSRQVDRYCPKQDVDVSPADSFAIPPQLRPGGGKYDWREEWSSTWRALHGYTAYLALTAKGIHQEIIIGGRGQFVAWLQPTPQPKIEMTRSHVAGAELDFAGTALIGWALRWQGFCRRPAFAGGYSAPPTG